MILYHGSREIVKYPEIRKAQYHKDFYFGFYCTKLPNQAKSWASRYRIKGYLDDTIYNYIQNYIDGKISRAAFWELAKFNHPTHQISFHTISALDTLKYIGSEVVDGSEK